MTYTNTYPRSPHTPMSPVSIRYRRRTLTDQPHPRAAASLAHLLVAAALAFLAVAGIGSPVAAQAVEGSLVSARDGRPLRGVTVTLVDMAAQPVASAVSGPGGAFVLRAPEPGTFMLLVDQEGYAAQLSDPLELVEGVTERLDLTVRSEEVGARELTAQDTLQGEALLQAAIADACAGSFQPSLHAIVFGTVVDEATGTTIPGAQAELRWEVSGMGNQDRTAGTDEAGAFLICDVPAAQSIRMRANMSGVVGDEEERRFRAGTMSRVDLVVELSDPDRPGNIIGRVLDNRTGQPLQGAEVRLRESDRQVLTNERGVFVMRDVASGPDVLEVEMLGYAERMQPVQVIGGRAQEITVRVATRPVELAPLVVTVKPRQWFSDMAGLQERMAIGNGFFIMRDDLDQSPSRQLGEVLRTVPGARVRRSGGALSGQYTIQLRGAANMLNQACPPVLWVDGIKWSQGNSAFADLVAWEMEAVEVYRGAAEVPGEFSGGDARCGVVVVWTRRGRGFTGG